MLFWVLLRFVGLLIAMITSVIGQCEPGEATAVASLRYPGFADAVPITCGSAVDRLAFTGSAPLVTTAIASVDKSYSVVMIDPDAPCPEGMDSGPVAGPWLHWLVVNVRGDQLMGGATINSPDVIMEYADPTPP